MKKIKEQHGVQAENFWYYKEAKEVKKERIEKQKVQVKEDFEKKHAALQEKINKEEDLLVQQRERQRVMNMIKTEKRKLKE